MLSLDLIICYTINKNKVGEKMTLSEKLNVLMKKIGIDNPTKLCKRMEEANLYIPYTTICAILNGNVKNLRLDTANKFKAFFNSILPLNEYLTLDDLLDTNIDINVKLFSLNQVNLEGLDSEKIKDLNKYADYLRSLDSN